MWIVLCHVQVRTSQLTVEAALAPLIPTYTSSVTAVEVQLTQKAVVAALKMLSSEGRVTAEAVLAAQAAVEGAMKGQVPARATAGGPCSMVIPSFALM